MPIGNGYPVRATTPELDVVEFNLTGAGAAIMTKPTTGAGRGYASNARTAAGRFTLTLTEVGAYIASFNATVHTAATVAPMLIKYVPGSLSQSAKTIQVEIWDLATPSLADPPAASVVDFRICFGMNPVP